MPQSPAEAQVQAGSQDLGKEDESQSAPNKLLFDLSAIDLKGEMVSKQGLELVIPHRGEMALLDRVIWHTPDYCRGVAVHRARPDEFWCAGHFPPRPIMPGVIMVEIGAQLAAFLYNVRKKTTNIAVFLRIDECSFRAMVEPGQDLIVLCQEIKASRRRFISEIQGVVGDKVAFEAQITGMTM
ncbi:MAG: 3-hydroxyacyl-ACP dehydratase FabZ family protein [Phycisphaerales bacterium]